MKAQRVASVPQNRPIIVAEFQGYLTPPHCKASKSMTQVGANTRNPTGSSLLNESQKDIVVLSDSLVGHWVKTMLRPASPPIGKLM